MDPMVNNLTNIINKMNIHFSSQLIEHKNIRWISLEIQYLA